MIGILSNDSNSRKKTTAVLLASLVAASMMFMTVTAGVAAAANSDSDTLSDETVSIDNSTEEVYLEVTNSSGDNLNYTVYGVEDGITTQVDSGQISAASGETNQLTLAADSETYDAYRFVVTEDPTDGDNETAEAIEELGEPREAFYTSVPQPMTRGELITTANTYFSALQRRGPDVTCPVTEDCHRIENGEPTTNVPVPEGETAPDPEEATTYSYHWTTRQQLASGLTKFVTRIRDRRFVSVDRERGLVFAFGFFDHAAGETRTFETADGRTVTTGPEQPWTWYIAEIFKVEDGKLSEIEAIMREVPYGMTSGWSNRVEGISDEPRNVTGVPES